MRATLNGQILDNEYLPIRLNLANIESKSRKPYLIIHTICIRVNLRNVQGTLFVVFTGTDDNRLQNYKTTKLFLCRVVVVVVVVMGFEFNF